MLGTDLVRRVPLDSDGRFGADDVIDVALPAGFGPRHLLVESSGDVLVLGERTAELARIAADGSSVRAIWPTMPVELGLAPGIIRGPGENPSTDAAGRPLTWAADLALGPDGHHVYTSERRTSLLSVTTADGRLLGTVATEEQPRGIGLDPTGRWLLATGEQSSTVSLYTVDPDDGLLRLSDQAPTGAGALWVEPVPVG